MLEPRRLPNLLRGLLLTTAGVASMARAQTVTIDTTARFQTVDGFGTCLGEAEPANDWWQQLYFTDMQYSIMRMDLTPNFMPDGGVTTDSFCSPWYANSAGALHLPQADGGCGPDNTCVRPYTSAADYSGPFGGCAAAIAVMGPDITANVRAFDFGAVANIGHIAQLGSAHAAELGDFKLYGSLWSPAPWVKLSSGDSTPAGSSLPAPAGGALWPFIWGGNFAGGMLDVSGVPIPQLNDGTANTSALTQFTRLLAAYLKGFQDTYQVKFYALSIQNELDFEEFYNSMLYPTTASYLVALKAVRAEFDAQPDLKDIKILGPEDVIGGDAYGMYRYGSAGTPSERDKNLNFLNAIASDPVATAAIGGFNIHGYAADGVTAAGASSQLWDWWVNGWAQSPAGGLPSNVVGFSSFGKPSWMTETSGEATSWLAFDSNNFPSQGAFAIAVGMHETLVAGQESAFLYWQLTDGTTDGDAQSLTGTGSLATAPKYNAMKHFARYIRPGSVRVSAAVSGPGAAQLLASAYLLDAAGSLTIILINESASSVTASLNLPAAPAGIGSYQAFTSSEGFYWVNSTLAVSAGSASVAVPGYGVVTLYGVGTGSASSSTGGSTGGSIGGSATSSTGGSATGTSGVPSTGSTGGGAAPSSGSTSMGSPGSGSTTGAAGVKRSGCSSAGDGPGAVLALGVAALIFGRRRR